MARGGTAALALLATLLGCPGHVADSTVLRHGPAGRDEYLLPRHQDAYDLRSHRHRVVRAPLGEVTRAGGAIALAAGSHRRGLRTHVKGDRISYAVRCRTALRRAAPCIPADTRIEAATTASRQRGS